MAIRTGNSRRPAFIAVTLVGALVAVAVIGSTVFAQAPTVPPPVPSGVLQRTIAVSGTGTATLAPDLATFSAGVTETNANVTDAQNSVNTKANAIIDALRQRGVDVDKDVKTTGYSVQPQYNYPSNSAPVLTGYRVTSTVTVMVRDIKKVGELLDAVTKAGANQVGSVSFGLSDPEGASRAAREQAVQNARGKADTLAKATGVGVGMVMTIEDQSVTPAPPRPAAAAAPAAGAAATAAPPPIQPGETTITVTVRVTWAIA